MKNITFKAISIEGFGSFLLSQKFLLNRLGINIINGPNGAGKTTVFNCLYWILYSNNLKGLTNSKLPTKEKYRTDSWRGTRGVLSVNVDGDSYMIARHDSFKGTTKGLQGGSKLMIFKNGELMADELHKKDQQIFIENLIGLDSKAFLSSVLFGQRMKKFIEADASDKRKIFESVFDMEFIEDARSNAVNHKNDLVSSINTIETKISTNDDKLQTLEDSLKNNKDIIKNFKKDKEKRISDIESEMKTEKSFKSTNESDLQSKKSELSKIDLMNYRKSVKSLDIEEDNLIVLNKELRILNRKFKDHVEEISDSHATIKSIEEKIKLVNKNCPTCSQPLPKKDIDKVINNLKKDITTENENISLQDAERLKVSEKIKNKELSIHEQTKKTDNLKKDVDSFKDDKTLFDSLTRKINSLESDIQNNERNIAKISTRLANEKSTKPPKVNISEIQEKIENLDTEILKLEKELKLKSKELERTEWWIKKGYGSSGLRSYVFNSMLTLLNKSMEKYTSRLGFKVKFSIDMTKASKPFITKCYNSEGIDMDYEEFSGGEKARIDISSAFAMHDLVSSTVNIDILIMDEFFEGLDDAGMEDVSDLVNLKCNGKSLYIITHRNNIDFVGSKTINFYKENNNTVIE